MVMSQRPRGLRLLAACHRCHSRKIKCSGKKPCTSCRAHGKSDECVFPHKERKVTIPESYLRRLEEECERYHSISQHPTPKSIDLQDSPAVEIGSESRGEEEEEDEDEEEEEEDEGMDITANMLSEEVAMMNPLFDGQPENVVNESCSEPGFIGEASCIAFSNRLLQSMDPEYTPSTAGFVHHYRMGPDENHLRAVETTDMSYFPERMHAKLLLSVARRFIGNYHPLYLGVTFIKELNAVYRRELVPSAMWVCKFWALMSLGEIYSNRRRIIETYQVPGTAYYIKAVRLLQISLEESSLMQVEVLMLLAWASNALGRVQTAYYYSGTAMRLATSMGMHRPASRGATLTPVEREGRRRTWWVLYFFDRFTASKLGQPISIRDEDIDVEMPSMEGLTEEEQEEFLDPQPLIMNIKLAQIIGNMLTNIYNIPKTTTDLRIDRVHDVLKQLRQWQDDLPPEMRMKGRGTLRTVCSIHLAYNQLIIQTTRPVLLHLFKAQFRLGDRLSTQPDTAQKRQGFSSITLALAKSCVDAAQGSGRIIEGLFLDGALALFGYWDAHHIFSAALIIVISSLMNPSETSFDTLDMLLSILRSMRDDGNIPANDYCETLSRVQAGVAKLRTLDQAQQQLVFDSRFGIESYLPGGGITAAGYNYQTQGCLDRQGTPSNQSAWNMGDILGNPLIDSFLHESRACWPELFFSADGTLNELELEIEEQFNLPGL